MVIVHRHYASSELEGQKAGKEQNAHAVELPPGDASRGSAMAWRPLVILHQRLSDGARLEALDGFRTENLYLWAQGSSTASHNQVSLYTEFCRNGSGIKKTTGLVFVSWYPPNAPSLW